MRTGEQASSADVFGIGIAFAVVGGYFVLVGLGVLPEPTGAAAHAPAAVVIAAGAAFAFAGLTCMVRAKAGLPDHQSEMPDNAPCWLQLAYRALAVGTTASLAAIGTWIAFGSGPRVFSVAVRFAELRTAGETVGRVVFGLGAVIVWIYVVVVAVGTIRKLFNSRG